MINRGFLGLTMYAEAIMLKPYLKKLHLLAQWDGAGSGSGHLSSVAKNDLE